MPPKTRKRARDTRNDVLDATAYAFASKDVLGLIVASLSPCDVAMLCATGRRIWQLFHLDPHVVIMREAFSRWNGDVGRMILFVARRGDLKCVDYILSQIPLQHERDLIAIEALRAGASHGHLHIVKSIAPPLRRVPGDVPNVTLSLREWNQLVNELMAYAFEVQSDAIAQYILDTFLEKETLYPLMIGTQTFMAQKHGMFAWADRLRPRQLPAGGEGNNDIHFLVEGIQAAACGGNLVAFDHYYQKLLEFRALLFVDTLSWDDIFFKVCVYGQLDMLKTLARRYDKDGAGVFSPVDWQRIYNGVLRHFVEDARRMTKVYSWTKEKTATMRNLRKCLNWIKGLACEHYEQLRQRNLSEVPLGAQAYTVNGQQIAGEYIIRDPDHFYFSKQKRVTEAAALIEDEDEYDGDDGGM
jgi:hypothetical protein